jgi:hypothetical protein
MRFAFFVAAFSLASVTALEAAPVATPRQPRIYHRNPQDCADGKLNPLFMSDWWYDLNAAMAERRLTDAQHEAIETRMLALANELATHNPDSNPALLVDFCRKLNALRPHWSQW